MAQYEMFPTQIRSIALQFTFAFSNFAMIIAPFI